MTDSAPEQAAVPYRPLPVAIVPGLQVCVMPDGSPGIITGIWQDVALGNVCPAPTLLPIDVTENDRRNASATVLRELLALQQVAELTPDQTTTLEGLVNLLCEV